jgi:hypothetical protein
MDVVFKLAGGDRECVRPKAADRGDHDPPQQDQAADGQRQQCGRRDQPAVAPPPGGAFNPITIPSRTVIPRNRARIGMA